MRLTAKERAERDARMQHRMKLWAIEQVRKATFGS